MIWYINIAQFSFYLGEYNSLSGITRDWRAGGRSVRTGHTDCPFLTLFHTTDLLPPEEGKKEIKHKIKEIKPIQVVM